MNSYKMVYGLANNFKLFKINVYTSNLFRLFPVIFPIRDEVIVSLEI